MKYPGLYELPHGTSLRELIYDFGGGLTEDAGELKAVIPGGLSVQFITPDQLDTPLDYENLAKQGSSLGSAGVIVIGANQSMVEVARRTVAFYREESCGKCTPCREGTPWLEAILERIEHGEGRVEDIALLNYIADMIGGKSFCPFGYAAVWGLQSNLAKFAMRVRRRDRRSQRPADHPDPPDLPARRRRAVGRDCAEFAAGREVQRADCEALAWITRTLTNRPISLTIKVRQLWRCEMLTVTLSSKGQIVLPQGIRQTLGLQEGDKLEVTLRDRMVLLAPVPAERATGWQRWRGELAGTDALAEHLTEHAAEVERERLS